MGKTSYFTWGCEMIKKSASYWAAVGLIWFVFGIWVYFNNDAVKYALWLLYASLAIMIVPFAAITSYRVWKQAHPEIIKDQQKHPNLWVSVHVCSIDTFPIDFQQGNYVNSRVCFCNALFYDIELMNLGGTAIIDRIEANVTPIASIKLKRGFTPITLQLKAKNELGASLPGNPFKFDSIKMDIELIGYDNKNNEYKWSTTYGG